MALPTERKYYSQINKITLYSKMLTGYLDNCIQISTTVLIAELLQRLFIVLYEYIAHIHHYLPEDRLCSIFKRAYSFHLKTICLTIILVILSVARFSSTGNLTSLVPSHVFLAYMPIYWIFSYAQLSYSHMGYVNWIRDNHGLDYAAGMASNYFHGYLKLALPEHKGDSLKNRMQIYENSQNVTFGIHRLVILIPDDMFVNGVIESDLLERVTPLEVKYVNRAGVERPFKHAVYKLKKAVNGKKYFFVMEGATPMLSFFDAMHSKLSSTWQMQEMKREIWLKFCKHLKELLQSWPETRNQAELFIYNSRMANGQYVDIGELLIARLESYV